MSILLLVRHGQASWGTEDYDRLSELGERQARVLAFERLYAGQLIGAHAAFTALGERGGVAAEGAAGKDPR